MDKWKQDRTETGPSWNDVQEYLRDLAKTHNRAVLVEIGLLPDNHGRTTFGLWVRVVAYSIGKAGARVERAKGCKWPHTDHRTMPALLLKLAHDLEWELSMVQLEAEGQAAF